jgi:cell division septation protein DedD
MKDEQASEEKLMGELDLMYRHVADLESGQVPIEQNDDPNEHGQISDQEVPTHAKIIPFPGHRMRLLSGEPSEASEEEPKRKRKPSFRTYLIVASFTLIFSALALVILPLNVMIGPRGSEKGEPHQLTFPSHSQPSPTVQREEEVLQNIEERQHQAETMLQQTAESISPSHQTIGSKFPFDKTKHYSVQVGAFRNWENASERMDALRMKNLEPYWIEMESRSRRTIYIVFSGYFTERNEAAIFMKGKDILKNYPDSFVREISFQEKKR